MDTLSTDRHSSVPLYLIAAFFCALSVFFVLQWRTARATAEATRALAHTFGRQLRGLGQKQTLLSTRLGALAGSIASEPAEAAVRAAGAPPSRSDENVGTAEGDEPLVADVPEDVADHCALRLSPEEPETAEPLPEGLRPASYLADETLAELVTQYRKDPERRLSAAETARALEILAATRARVEVLRSRALRAKVEAADVLRERGEFVDYAPGETYHREPGVITHGEDLGDAGMRIFYLFPEEFPDIYDLEAERRRAPARGIREVLAIVNGPAGVSGG